MSSGSPRARIDQFYASRKRRPPSSLKDEKSDKGSKSPLHESSHSPAAKGTLETYLVKSPGSIIPRAALCRSSSFSPVKRDPIKRNLKKDIDLSLPSFPSTSTDCSNKEEEEKATEPQGGANLELKKFATDFLSLYCSDLASAVNVNVPSEEESKGHKRNGSPSLLVACSKTCTKKQCVADQTDPTVEIWDDSSGKDCPVPAKAEPMSRHSGVGIGGMSLRKCNSTPNSSLSKKALFANETPKSVSRRSMFSPGDEFWNEAIQVADGLFVPADEKILQDKSSCVAPQGARNTSRSDSSELGAQERVLDDCAKPIEKDIEGNEIFSTALKHNEVSPLPVKHFDFSHEVNNVVRNSSHYCSEEVGAVTGAESGLHNGSLRHNSLQASSGLAGNVALTKQFSNAKPKSDATSLSTGRLGQITQSGSSLAADERGGFSPRKNKTEHMQNDKILSAGLSVPACRVSTVEDTSSGKSVANAIHGEASTPSSSMPLKDQLQLTSWLPSEVCSIYMKKGISKLYSWQVDCLLIDGVLEKRNLVYCASTSAGKSFVAEILMLRRVISTRKMALLVLPYVSICAEKAEHLELLLEPLGKHVRSFYGNQGGGSLPKDTSVAVCTIEKANSLINRLLEEGRLSEVGIIVIDELHMVGDQHRGYLLELMLTKLRYAAGEGSSESSNGDSSGSSSGKTDPAHGLQIVGMSATMPNVSAVANWLQYEFVKYPDDGEHWHKDGAPNIQFF